MARRTTTPTPRTRPGSRARGAATPLRIRSRLLLLLAVPLLVLFGVTALGVRSAVGDFREAGRLSDGARVGQAAYGLVDALQAERAVLAAGGEVTAEQRAAVDAARAGMAAAAADAGGAIELQARRAVARTEAAQRLAANGAVGIVAIDGLTPAINQSLALARTGFDPGSAVDDQSAVATGFLASAQEAAALERDLVSAMTRDAGLVALRFGQVSQLGAQQQILVREAASNAGDALSPRIERVGDALGNAATTRQRVLTGTITPAALAAWQEGADARIADLARYRDDTAQLAVAAVDDLAASARELLLLSVLASVATLLVTGLLVRNATRSIARPLQDLAAQAEEVALSRLPDAVRSQQHSSEEVHLPALRAAGAAEVQEVAGAFNDVQDTALRLAGEQALLRRNLSEALTNLGRRNQALLGRQLDFISSLEQRETDPAFLDHLFRLDHLASRMRRNAESLLVLAGSETPRRRRTPAGMAEVVRAAMSEVESFERVRLSDLGGAEVRGPAVIDLVHLLAELIENGLSFSSPDTTVEVEGRSLGQGGYQLAVIDHGVGLADVELQAANERLAGEDEVDGMPTRYLGQYVVARLARKLDARVRLQPSVGGRGVTALVTLPAGAMVNGHDRSSVARPLPGTRAASEQNERFAPGAGLAGATGAPVVDPGADPFGDPQPVPVAGAAALDVPSFLASGPVGADADAAATPPPAPAAVPDQVWEPDPFLEPTPFPEAAPTSFEPAAFEPGSFETTTFGSVPAEPAPFEPASFEPVPFPEPTSSAAASPAPSAEPVWFPAEHPSVVAKASPSTEDLVAPLGDRGADPFADPFAELHERPEEPAPPPASVLEGDRSGGLPRRVPGEALAGSPMGATAPMATPSGQRSADGVRSILSSLQAGRTRGQVGDGPADHDPREVPGDH